MVNSSLISPDGLACDWYTGKLYWTDGEKNRIEVTSIDGRQRKVLFWTDIYQPRAIALVPMRSIFFWTDWGDVPKIERAGMNGDPSTRSVVVSDDIFWPNGLTVDYDNELVYWVDGRYKFIAVMDYYGRNRRKIVSDGLEYPFAITYSDQRLYWTDWRTWCIHTLDLRATGSGGNGNGRARELFHGEYIPGDIEVWDQRRQPAPLHNPCKPNNANCSHLCLLSSKPPGYSCACPTGVKLLADGHSCADGPQELLLIVQRNEVSMISLDSPDYTNFVLPLTGIKHAIAIDFDPVDEMLYWTDEQAHVIRRYVLAHPVPPPTYPTACACSTETDLLKLTGDIQTGTDKKRLTLRLLFDFSRHLIPSTRSNYRLRRLSRLRFHRVALQWIKSYISGRR